MVNEELKVLKAEERLARIELQTEKEKNKNKKKKGIFKDFKLVKPKVELPSYSPTKAIRGIAQDSPKQLVREVEKKEIVQDNRSLYFKEEFKNQKEKTGSWLSKW